MQQTTRGHKLNDSDIDRHCCDNLKYDDSGFGCKEGEENGIRKRQGKKAEWKKKTLKNRLKKEI